MNTTFLLNDYIEDMEWELAFLLNDYSKIVKVDRLGTY
jgi:hypothetical protein